MQIYTGMPPSRKKMPIEAPSLTIPLRIAVHIYIYIGDNGNNELLTSVRSQPQTATKRAAVVSEYP